MRVLLDEHLPLDLAKALEEFDASTVQAEGWLGLKNGELLAVAGEAGFNVLLTNDRSIEHQQNLLEFGLGVVVIGAASNRLRDLLPMIEAIRETIGRSVAGEVQHVAG